MLIGAHVIAVEMAVLILLALGEPRSEQPAIAISLFAGFALLAYLPALLPGGWFRPVVAVIGALLLVVGGFFSLLLVGVPVFIVSFVYLTAAFAPEDRQVRGILLWALGIFMATIFVGGVILGLILEGRSAR